MLALAQQDCLMHRRQLEGGLRSVVRIQVTMVNQWGFVFGKDEKLANTYQKNRIRQGYTQPLTNPESGETDWRNYTVFNTSMYDTIINQGEGIWTTTTILYSAKQELM